MNTLDDIILMGKDAREIRRAMAVKMVLHGFGVRDIEALLNVSDSFVSKWKGVYEEKGAPGLALGYKGSEGYLTGDQRKEVISFLRSKITYTPEELRDYPESEYGVLYKSKQSYYDLLHEGGINWKKNEKTNPKRDEEEVSERRKFIMSKIGESEEDIREGRTVVLMEDECHLLWGDTSGYIWGRKNEKIGVPMTNERERQTYYGAVNVLTGEFHALPYEIGNGANTVSFVKHLEEIYDGSGIILIWDGATYHKYGEMRRYLEESNGGLNEKDWKVTCVLFPPYAPDQNPVEEIWRKGKNFLRRHFYENKTFRDVKESFFNFLTEQVFSFPKLEAYIS